MAKLIVKPFDPSARGSYKQRKQLLNALNRITTARQSDKPGEIFAAQAALEEAVIGRLATDDGSPVATTLVEISADDFDALIDALLTEGKKSSVPPANGGS